MADKQLEHLAIELGGLLRQRGWWLATAESCTGGWIGEVLTAIPGSSTWFDRGYVTYSNRAKCELLGVPAECIQTFGAVSGETVQAMVEGAMRMAKVDLAVAVSGIAGPDGGTPDKPVGTVWLGWVSNGSPVIVQRYHFTGDREAIRRAAVEAALQGLIALAS
ncbi:nicotinamide-nucleotide amidohydrolase family protein [Chitinivorax sp. B]|uniref:CinA family protein n=1 Tax=Chitinivorax sp. B TaxID=2502235 RepID=UPI0010F9BD5A|nr:nicotinamide-nucleotide amidohydrolase family protein [Chitinivorax sp. B]